MTASTRKTFWTSVPGILTGLAALIASVTGLYYALGNHSNGGLESGENRPKTNIAESADSLAKPDPGALYEQTAREMGHNFIAAYQVNNLPAILAMTDTPFYLFGKFHYRDEDVKENLELFFQQKGGNFDVHRSSIRPIGQLTAESKTYSDEFGTSINSVAQTLGLTDDDFIMDFDWSIQTYSGTMWLFMKVKEEEISIVGWTNSL